MQCASTVQVTLSARGEIAGAAKRGRGGASPRTRSTLCKAAHLERVRRLAASAAAVLSPGPACAAGIAAAVRKRDLACEEGLMAAAEQRLDPACEAGTAAAVPRLDTACAAGPACEAGTVATPGGSYRDLKNSDACRSYTCAWRTLLQPPSPLASWIQKPPDLEGFGS